MSAAAPFLTRTPQTAALVWTLLAGVGVLYGSAWAVRALPCWAVLIAVALTAFPIWQSLVERALLRRQAILRTVARESSTVMRWFWRGTLTKIGLVFLALGVSALLLGVLSQLRPPHWIVLVLDALALGLVFKAMRRSLRQQVQDAYQGLIARMWPVMAVNVVVLTIAFVAVDYYSGHRVLQGPWLEVAGRAFDEGTLGVVCPAAASWLGVLNVIDQVSWKAAIATIPTLPDGPSRILGWAIFLGWTGLGAVIVTRFLLGLVAWVSSGTTTSDEHRPGHTMWRSFVATILVLAVPYLYASWKLSTWEPSLDRFGPGSSPTVQVAPDPCANFQFDTTGLRSSLTGEIQQARLESHRMADQRIDTLLDSAFRRAERGVDAYLEWYFSLYGDYSRLFAVMVGDLGEVMQQNLVKHVFDDTGFSQLVESQAAVIQGEVAQQMLGVAASLPEQVRDAIPDTECEIPSLDLSALADLNTDRIRAAVSTASAVTVGTVTAKTLGKKAVAAAASKAAASGTMKTAVKIAGKAAGKKVVSVPGSFIGGTLVCSAGGPIAVACGVGAAAIAWVVTDKVAIEIEEYLNRDEMRADLMAVLNEQRAAMRKELQAIYYGIADAYAAEIDARADRVFVPASDGV